MKKIMYLIRFLWPFYDRRTIQIDYPDNNPLRPRTIVSILNNRYQNSHNIFLWMFASETFPCRYKMTSNWREVEALNGPRRIFWRLWSQVFRRVVLVVWWQKITVSRYLSASRLLRNCSGEHKSGRVLSWFRISPTIHVHFRTRKNILNFFFYKNTFISISRLYFGVRFFQ